MPKSQPDAAHRPEAPAQDAERALAATNPTESTAATAPIAAAPMSAPATPDALRRGVPALDPPPQTDWSFPRLIASASAVKFVNDTASQMFSPYLPIIAAGLGSNLIVLGRLAGITNLMGLTAPLFGALADRVGHRHSLRIALLLSALGIALITVSPGVGIATVGFIIFGLGRGGFSPILLAYLSARLSYDQRARGLGILEYSWALAGIIGLSLVGLLISYTNWRYPLALLAALLLAASFFVRTFPPAHPTTQVEHTPRAEHTPKQALLAHLRFWFDFGHTSRSTWACIATGALIYFGATQIFITFGAWLTEDWGMGARQLGVAVLVLGLFDLAGSMGVSLFTDRFGKWRSVLLGIIVALAGYLLMTRIATTPALAVMALAIPRFGFEFSLVSYFSLLSEQAPAFRSRVMAMGAAVSLFMASCAGFLGPPIYTAWGMGGVGISAAFTSVLAMIVLMLWVRERGGVTEQPPDPWA